MQRTGNRRLTAGAAFMCIASLTTPASAQECETAKFFSSPPPFAPHNLGFSADIDGNVAIAGAYRRQPDGAAYIYERSTGQWS